MPTDEELIVTCLTPEIYKLNEKLKKENRASATEAEFLNAVETAMRNIIKAARADQEKADMIYTTNRIFQGLELHAYILIKPPKGTTRKENVALDLTRAEFEDFKKQFEVN